MFKKYSNATSSAFTIIELLVVIVVIGVLAAITIISYTGITQKAAVASLVSDLDNASKKLKLFYAENGVYPNSIYDCPTPLSGNICLKSSPSSIFSGYSANNNTPSQTFTLLASNNGIDYKVTNDSSPTPLTSAPLNPVSDWLATLQGDHFGNFYDLTTKKYATTTRSTSKTIYDPSIQKIYDVPANYLAINPRSDGKGGNEAVIEEARTNYALNSNFETDSDSNGTADGVSIYGGTNATVTWSRPVSSLYGQYAQNQQAVGLTGAGIYTGTTLGTVVASAGDIYTTSMWVNVPQISGCTVSLKMAIKNSSGTAIAYYGSSAISAPTAGWTRISVTSPALPVNTASFLIYYETNADFHEGDSYNINFDALQSEKGSFATSYIPTAATAATRNADSVSVPTTNWNASAGTLVAVTGISPAQSGYTWPDSMSPVAGWFINNSNYIEFFQAPSGTAEIVAEYGGATSFSTKSGSGYSTIAGSWATGQNTYTYWNGVQGGASSNVITSAPSGLPNTAMIGAMAGNGYYNGGIQRLVIYSSALSSSDVSTATNAVQKGP